MSGLKKESPTRQRW